MASWIFSLRYGPADQQSTVTLSSGQRDKAESPDAQELPESEANEAETVSLLSTQSTGWLFSGPQWSLHSSILLQLTFRPAWQGLPSYTNLSFSRDHLTRCCGRTRGKPVDFLSIVYTTRDIERVEQIDEEFDIRGIQESFKGLRIYLKEPDLEKFNLENIPEQYRADLSHQWNLPSHLTHEWDRLQEKTDTLPEIMNHRGPVLTFAMSSSGRAAPPLMWKVDLPANKHVSMETITVLNGKLETRQQSPTHVYINGYQSWSFTGSVVKGAKQPTSAQPDVFNKAFNSGGSVPPESTTVVGGASTTSVKPHYLSDFFTCISSDAREASDGEHAFPFTALDETGGPGLVLGWLSQHRQFGVLTSTQDLTTLEMHASCDNCLLKNSMTTDWAYAQLVSPHNYDEEPMGEYLVAVASHNVARPLQNGPLLTGWCSWYHYYSKINATNLKNNFVKLKLLYKTVPTNVAVVDDGYMTAWGDWDSLKPRKFPQGMGGVSKDIAEQGIRPGLWLAPFAADKHSKLAKQHAEWIIWNDEGRASNSANCGKFFYGLDATNPHVREYAYSCIRRAVQDWKYSVLKIDFLYAAVLKGNAKHDMSMTRAQAMHVALQTIRAAAGPHVFLIGCGCPIGSGIGYVDGMRVSADTGPTWYPAFPLPYWDNSTLPALRAMIRNSISRAPLGHRWWHNDPDCLLIGTTTSLTDMEVASAASIVAMTCGMMLLSDDLTKVPAKRMNTITKIFPMTGATAIVLDLHSTNDGLPSLLRLWCTDLYQPLADMDAGDDSDDHNNEATLLARRSSFSPDGPALVASERKRNCIHVVPGLGTWTLLSVSNWSDRQATLRIPSAALLPPPSNGYFQSDIEGPNDEREIHPHGYHVFGFWAGTYKWLQDPRTTQPQNPFPLNKSLAPHETELFHIKAVRPTEAGYIGSTLHFSCGYEVRRWESSKDRIRLQLRKDYRRQGQVLLYLPIPKVEEIEVKVGGFSAEWDHFAVTPAATNSNLCVGHVIRVRVVIHSDGSERDGEIVVKY